MAVSAQCAASASVPTVTNAPAAGPMLRLLTPAFCADPECDGLIRSGSAALLPDDRLFHPGCLTYFRRCGGSLPAAESIQDIEVEYLCKLPENPEMWRLEHLREIMPFELIAAKIPPENAAEMYLALADVYVRVAIKSSRVASDGSSGCDDCSAAPNETNLDRNVLIALAERFTPLSECVVLDKPLICGSESCGFEIFEGAAVQAADGTIYHSVCPRVLRFETGREVGPTKAVIVRYSCTPPQDHRIEKLLGDKAIAVLELAFGLLGTSMGSSLEDVRAAYLAVVDLIGCYGISGRDLERLAEKYAVSV